MLCCYAAVPEMLDIQDLPTCMTLHQIGQTPDFNWETLVNGKLKRTVFSVEMQNKRLFELMNIVFFTYKSFPPHLQTPVSLTEAAATCITK